MSFRGIDDDRSNTSHQVACDERTTSSFENTDVTARMTGSVQNLQAPARIPCQFEPFVVLESSININDAFKIPRRDGMRGYCYAKPATQVVGTTHVVLVEMREPNLTDTTFLKNVIEQSLFVLVRRRRIDDHNLVSSDYVTIRVCCRR